MDDINLKAKPREIIGKQVKALRREGFIPAIIYGQQINPISISLDNKVASKVLSNVTSSNLVIVDIDGDTHTTLVRDRQIHPVSGRIIHVDFQEVSLTETLRTLVSLELVGDAPAVKNLNGVLVTGQESIEIECLPQDLPNRITVDITSLEEFGDTIYVRDLVLPPNISVLTELDEMVVLITTPAAEEEVEEVVEELEEEPEVIERGKKEEEDKDQEEE